MSISATGVRLALGARTVLDEINLAIPAGRITAVVGPNGAGKSTLLRALAGQLSPVAGEFILGSRPLSAYGAQERARAIAYLPQERAVHWPLSVRSVVALGRLPYRDAANGTVTDTAAVENALQAMDATHLADRPISDLSGGERARVLVARAMAQDAPLLLADEPTAGLDPSHALALFARFLKLTADGRTVVVALHDLSLAARFAHHVVLVAGGRIAVSGQPTDVMTPEHLEPAFGVKMLCSTVDNMPIVVPVSTLP